MKNLSIEEQRELLTRRKEEYKNALTTSLQDTKAEISNKLQTIALAAGAIVAGYLVVKILDEWIGKKDSPPTAPQPSQELTAHQSTVQPAVQPTGFSLTHFLKEQLAFFLVSIAKDKLYELFELALQQLRQKTNNPTDQEAIQKTE
ncbi:MAG: hypothetical protein RMJ87_11220 [Cytophagales bacterium]|nr:hypothetical protein [Bernardetiaceae bacterium]MDW8205589.1 hypothetical protein [Cytophagales bacterium]